MTSKKENGQYFTTVSPFFHPAFVDWAKRCDLKNQVVLEPFAGGNNLIDMLKAEFEIEQYASFDIEPQRSDVKYNDSFANFPTGFSVCVTNPPYLENTAASNKGLAYPKHFQFSNMYKQSIFEISKHVDWFAVIVPSTFICVSKPRDKKLLDRCETIVDFGTGLFEDTLQPVCLALFGPKHNQNTKLWDGNHLVGSYSDVFGKIPSAPKQAWNITNQGQIFFRGYDAVKEKQMGFYEVTPELLTIYNKSPNHRNNLMFQIPQTLNIHTPQDIISQSNLVLNRLRFQTHDMIFPPFYNKRTDGKQRRRAGATLAKKIMDLAVFELQKNPQKTFFF